MKTKAGEEFISVVDKYKSITQYLWRIIVIESIVIVFLAFGYFELKETTRVQVELPSKLIYKYTPIVVAGISGANDEYFKMWGNYIIKELSNINYENVSQKLKLLSKMMHPQDYVSEKAKFNGLEKYITNSLLQQKFKITDSKLVVISKENDLIKESVIIVKGDANQLIGKNPLSKECSYKVKFEYQQGVIYVKKFTTDCF